MRIHQPLVAALVATTLSACSGGESKPSAESQPDSAGAVAIESVRTAVLQVPYADVFTLTLEPGQAIAPHEGSARVVYALNDYTIRFTEGSETREASGRTGEAHVHSAGTHAIANTGSTAARLLIVTRTDSGLPAVTTLAPLPDSTSAAGTTSLVDDDRFRVSVVTIPPAGELPEHAGLPRVVYALSDYTIRYEAVGTAPEERSFRSGEAHWHEADRHRISNTGTTEARYLVVQFKR